MNHRIILLMLLPALTACERGHEQVRHYTEVGGTSFAQAAPAPTPMAGGMPAAPQIAMAWKCPTGWQESAGAGFRLASFVAGEAECAILVFPEAMGGTDAKISMWLSQLNAPAPAPDRLVSFLANPETISTEGGLDCALYDLTALLGEAPPQTILAGLLAIDGKQVAVRIKGTPAAIAAQKSAFRSLCQSLVRK